MDQSEDRSARRASTSVCSRCAAAHFDRQQSSARHHERRGCPVHQQQLPGAFLESGAILNQRKNPLEKESKDWPVITGNSEVIHSARKRAFHSCGRARREKESGEWFCTTDLLYSNQTISHFVLRRYAGVDQRR